MLDNLKRRWLRLLGFHGPAFSWAEPEPVRDLRALSTTSSAQAPVAQADAELLPTAQGVRLISPAGATGASQPVEFTRPAMGLPLTHQPYVSAVSAGAAPSTLSEEVVPFREEDVPVLWAKLALESTNAAQRMAGAGPNRTAQLAAQTSARSLIFVAARGAYLSTIATCLQQAGLALPTSEGRVREDVLVPLVLAATTDRRVQVSPWEPHWLLAHRLAAEGSGDAMTGGIAFQAAFTGMKNVGLKFAALKWVAGTSSFERTEAVLNAVLPNVAFDRAAVASALSDALDPAHKVNDLISEAKWSSASRLHDTYRAILVVREALAFDATAWLTQQHEPPVIEAARATIAEKAQLMPDEATAALALFWVTFGHSLPAFVSAVMAGQNAFTLDRLPKLILLKRSFSQYRVQLTSLPQGVRPATAADLSISNFRGMNR